MLTIDPHPLLDLRAFITAFPKPLEELPSPAEVTTLLQLDAPAPLHSDDKVSEAVRALLRQGGFKPTGRSKPASEYLIKAVNEKMLAPINFCVDVCRMVLTTNRLYDASMGPRSDNRGYAVFCKYHQTIMAPHLQFGPSCGFAHLPQSRDSRSTRRR